MSFACKVLADSVAPSGKRLVTFEVRYPRVIHSELLTHRMLSRSSASSRAIPVEKMLADVTNDPFIPLYIGAAQKGMQAGEELTDEVRAEAIRLWLSAREKAVDHARAMHKLGAPKQVCNRIVEPWMWITVIVSATEWDNFFGLRCHEMAEPHFQHIARMMREEMACSTPRPLPVGGWHMPLIFPEDNAPAAVIARKIISDDKAIGKMDISEDHPIFRAIHEDVLKRVSVGRVGRVSYLTHDGKRDLQADLDLYERLMVSRPLHASPGEHVAQALAEPERIGNFIGWRQVRKTLADENIGGSLP